MHKRTKLVTISLVLVLLTACAIRNNPQVNAETTWRLNTASQLAQANKDYTTFFTDVKSAHSASILNDSQVSTLNSVGHNLKTALEVANREWSAYVSGTGTKAGVIAAILKAEEIMLQLTASRASMGAGHASFKCDPTKLQSCATQANNDYGPGRSGLVGEMEVPQ